MRREPTNLTLSLVFLTILGCAEKKAASDLVEKPIKAASDLVEKPKNGTCPGMATDSTNLRLTPPSPNPIPPSVPEPLTISDDIHLSFNCPSLLGVKWQEELRSSDLTLNGEVLVRGSHKSCDEAGTIPLLRINDPISPDLQKEVDAYNLDVKKTLLASHEALQKALGSAKSCSFEKQSDLRSIISKARKSQKQNLHLNYEPIPPPDDGAEAPTDDKFPFENLTSLPSSVLMKELSCLGNVELKPTSTESFMKTYRALQNKVSKDQAKTPPKDFPQNSDTSTPEC